MANIITVCRILYCIALLFCLSLSPAFYILYLLAGFTDMIDGRIARKTNTVSEFGSKLDTAADFIFFIVCLIKLLPILEMPMWLWLWFVIIAIVKISNGLSGVVLQNKSLVEHTIMNKVTGLLLFILPLTLAIIKLKYSAILLCATATFAAIQEGHFIRRWIED
ncbi:CDP-alcohol phosphatidyltransferase family protein [Marinilactibacillus psychrotolerans]|uniref:CDP-alcohol phosphatidyltransferase family protein n=2 Tax=Marinilactibacillus psychrotolerans TaxID=191770 RepID=A0A5R9C3D5_9LACT|nr:CDP-alcohol phosphatidyltransferase family protein [Marinilactibacillus psychrotolerans]TLQ07226.1 CDP-alcohol phosphatidyltransferase family protein [Marinilactibacillus psychrotolerans]SJN28998.1 putative CDP-alcohol phosphatidyltransferase [Marinilactibacillus psychrotolerans 42ea]